MRCVPLTFVLCFIALLLSGNLSAQNETAIWRITKKIRTEANGQKFTFNYTYTNDGRIKTVEYLSASGIRTITIDNFRFSRNNKPSSYVVTYNREGAKVNVSLTYDGQGRILQVEKTDGNTEKTVFNYRYTGNSYIIIQENIIGSTIKDNRIISYNELGGYVETVGSAASQTVTSTITQNDKRNPELEPYPDNFMGGYEAPLFLGEYAYGSEPQTTAIKDDNGHIISLTFATRTSTRKNEYTYTKIGAGTPEPVETGTKIIITTNINCTDGKLIVERILKSLDGVKSAVVDISTGKLLLDYSPDGTPYTEIIKQINNAGFDADRSISRVPDANPCKATTINPFNITQLKKIYQLREAAASPELKRRLVQQRTVIARNGFKYQVGNTGVSEKKLKDITSITKVSSSEMLRLKDADKNKPYNPEVAAILKNYKPAADASLQQFDARNYIKVPEVRTQKCGSCWAYAAVGILEMSYMAQRGYGTTTYPIDLSEKQALGCSGAGTCDGGFHASVLEWMKKNDQKLLYEDHLKDDDYFAKKSSAADAPFVDVLCNVVEVKKNYVQLADWGIVQKDKDWNKVAEENDIKEAIIKYGSVAVAIYASPVFQSLASADVFEEKEEAYKDSATNHYIIIIGWDNYKQAWLIRNSWGKDWGDDGYAWIKYTTNHIGKQAIWAVAKIPTPLKIPILSSENVQPITLTGEMLPGHQFTLNSTLTSPNGMCEFKNSDNRILLTTKFQNGSTSYEMINPFNDFSSIYKLYSTLPVIGSKAPGPFYLQDIQGNLFTPFGNKPFKKMVVTDSGNVIAYGKDDSILWSLNPVPPKIRRK